MLIKVAYSPVSNFDKAFIKIKSELDKESCVGRILGSEASGTIEEVGPGMDQSLKGRKVAFCHQAWTQYAVVDRSKIMLFEESADLR